MVWTHFKNGRRENFKEGSNTKVNGKHPSGRLGSGWEEQVGNMSHRGKGDNGKILSRSCWNKRYRERLGCLSDDFNEVQRLKNTNTDRVNYNKSRISKRTGKPKLQNSRAGGELRIVNI